MAKLLLIRIRTGVDMDPNIKYTLESLNLRVKYNAVALENTLQNMGMVKVVKDFITFGEVSDETLEKLKPRLISNNKTYRLHPPRGGFKRKGIKLPFKMGGNLGKRDNINELALRMI